jgi:two-component sensor histidine kinase
LNVRDNGIGFPEDLDFRNTESLGMHIVLSLVEQLEGTIELDSGEGTSFTIGFRALK